ncbi:hypothetical protein [Paenimyroides ceti]
MKTYKIIFAFFLLLGTQFVTAQRNSTATVVAKNYDISDNLDLQAVASVFGDARDLEDFEKKLNDPSLQLSNLDLNGDNYVDYLRVIEVAEGDNRVIVIQAVLGQDTFQDVATIEIEKQRSSTVNVQIVGNPYIYGPNYIYEPYYYRTPIFFDYFWLATYRPYYSPWYWGYYPTYYSYWAPMPVFRYQRHVYPHINTRNRYVYTDNRRISRADRMYSGVSRNAYERSNPGRSFTNRNANVTNRYALDQSRGSAGSRNNASRENSRNSVTGSTINNRGSVNASSRGTDFSSSRNSSSVRNSGATVRSDFNANGGRSNSSRVNLRSDNSSTINRSSSTLRSSAPINSSRSSAPVNSSRIERSTPSRSFDSSSSRSSNSSFSRPSNSGGSFSRSSGATMSRGSSGMSTGGGSSRSGGGGGRSSR